MVKGLTNIGGIKPFRPAGAFYLFSDVCQLYEKLEGVSDSVSFCDYLLEEVRIACIPGKAFGDDRCVRFSFVANEISIREGLYRLSKV